MKIEVGWLQHHPHETEVFHLSKKIEGIEIAGETVTFPEEVHVDLTLTNTGRMIVGNGKINAVAILTCGRCLRPYQLPMLVDFYVQLVEEGAAVTRDEVETGDVLVIRDEKVDLEPLVIENIVVNLPLVRVCNEDCRGFCPGCGVDLAVEACRCQEEEIDPRWEALKALLDNKN
ncbi:MULTISPECIES: YceD family protein [Syntrophothermus]|uniref:DUF177 domain-containing protein n=1 Tax=Syntrophothermus lipocalidus (strain DSM 12680 / TGB-C1) TaxID=643648 RepID=D7CMX8_SYNLT|nr:MULTISPECIES: DUF177 domain-containing protein [Syntrophothermus]ADI02063.1 protein of unknown function DUF177 [Syntrophothermus lipocalidus DSM 12680]NSW82479.1 DUF177 domain-containing protein [Syntrophothermus sp.]